jgi:retron-type reverse transcriptase
MALVHRDRVLQWAIYRKLNPLYEKTYIYDSYGCINNKGKEKAAKRIQYWLRQTDRKGKRYYCLKLDISKFFYRVDHEILLEILSKKIKDERILQLLEKIINSDKRAFGVPLGVEPSEIDPKDMLFDKGMPVGNLTSQMFENVYLNEVDQYIKHELHIHYYVRYADDMLILHDDYRELVEYKRKIEAFLLERLKLNLNNKTTINPTTHNIDFVGFIINKDEIRLRKATVRRMKVRMKYVLKQYENGEITRDKVNATMQSYFGMVSHCTNEGLKRWLLDHAVMHCTDASRMRAREVEA